MIEAETTDYECFMGGGGGGWERFPQEHTMYVHMPVFSSICYSKIN